jgi:hypothetical protein
MEVDSTLLQDIRKGQLEDEKLQEIKWNIKEGKSPGCTEDEQSVLRYKRRICVPDIKEMKDMILWEARDSAYFIHPGGNKMYQDLTATFRWYGMKLDVAKYVVLCDTCQIMKVEHQWPVGLLQLLKMPEWKWEEIGMAIIVELPRTQNRQDSIWVIIDRLTKVAHFIPGKATYTGPQLTELYISRIVCI